MNSILLHVIQLWLKYCQRDLIILLTHSLSHSYNVLISDWNQTSYPNQVPLAPDQMPFILPLVLQYLCPLTVSVIGLAAISAAAMSSADSTTLSTASIFANNWYRGLFRTKVNIMIKHET